MFAIYDIQGCCFLYTLENVSKARAAQDSVQTRSATNASAQEPRLIPENTSGKTGKAHISGKDIEACREMHHLNQREPVYHACQFMSYPGSTVSMGMGNTGHVAHSITMKSMP